MARDKAAAYRFAASLRTGLGLSLLVAVLLPGAGATACFVWANLSGRLMAVAHLPTLSAGRVFVIGFAVIGLVGVVLSLAAAWRAAQTPPGFAAGGVEIPVVRFVREDVAS